MIIPAVEAWDLSLLQKLEDSFKRHGWTFRPLLGVRLPDDRGIVRAVNGAHRIAASRSVGIAHVPVYLATVDGPLPKFGSMYGWFEYFANSGNAIACGLIGSENTRF